MSNTDNKESEVLLKVENLCQYFKMGNSALKAVDDVSFYIKKGEVFSLVGESGCGKTTTGRTVIKLYDATSGNVWLKGQRICAGTKSYENEIAEAKKACNATNKQLQTKKAAELAALGENADAKAKIEIEEEYKNIIAANKAEFAKVRAEKSAQIKSAKYDQKKSDKTYSKNQIAELDKEYVPQFEELNNQLALNPNDEKLKNDYAALNTEYREKYRIAKRERLITKIQMIFQDPISSLNPRMTVREIIAEGLIIKGHRNKDYLNEKVYEMLKLVGLVPEHADRYPHEFSGGQRQRIGIARSVIMEPELLIADEPISALDVSIQAQVITLLNELREKIGLTILFIAHDISVVKYFSDRIAVMYYGKIMELASRDELFARPMHPYTRALLSAVPFPDPNFEKQRKRIIYNPLAEHNYSINKPSMKEIAEGHFVYCNDDEAQKYKTEFNLK